MAWRKTPAPLSNTLESITLESKELESKELESQDATMRRLIRWIRGEDGATAVEYAVMLTLVVAACIGAVRLLGSAVGGSLSHSATEMDTYFPTGS